jgi:hypothetical protein
MIWLIHGILIVSAALFFVFALMDVLAARAPSDGPSKAISPDQLEAADNHDHGDFHHASRTEVLRASEIIDASAFRSNRSCLLLR